MKNNDMHSSTAKSRLLFLAGHVAPYGGGSCVEAWALQALKEYWDITILCTTRPDFEGVNRHFGTCLKAEEFSIWQLPFPLRYLERVDPDPFSMQSLAWLMRFCQARAHTFDALISCDDEIDFGRPGIQYTHYPHLERHLEILRTTDRLSTTQRAGYFLRGRLPPWLLVSGIRLSRIRSNLMVTNSNWTAHRLREVYGVEPVVLYPPVFWKHARREWSQRRNAFVALGRLSPQKRLLEIVDILEQVRSRGFDVGLEIIGDEDRIAGRGYVQQLRARLARAGNWVRIHQSVSRAELEDLVSDCRYGINGMTDEHFGIAVAEMLRGGCIVFVPNDGGQVEIVGDQPELRYRSDDDAVDRICRVLANEQVQSRLRGALEKRASLFTESTFMSGMQKLVAGFAARNPVSS